MTQQTTDEFGIKRRNGRVPIRDVITVACVIFGIGAGWARMEMKTSGQNERVEELRTVSETRLQGFGNEMRARLDALIENQRELRDEVRALRYRILKGMPE
jgi:hypothetical protein